MQLKKEKSLLGIKIIGSQPLLTWGHHRRKIKLHLAHYYSAKYKYPEKSLQNCFWSSLYKRQHDEHTIIVSWDRFTQRPNMCNV